MSENILWFDEISKESAGKVGGKALRLSELKKGGFKVPKAFCLTTDLYELFLKHNKLGPRLSMLRVGRDKSILKTICERIIKQILKGKIPGDIREEINRNVKKLDADRLAIRSSATCEDLQLASFAGQFESYLDVLVDQIFDNVRKCWASIFSNRVLTYTLYHDIALARVKMAVLVQEMIDGDKGGVMFTKNIIDVSQPYVVLIEASKGKADDVVSGLVEPERVIVNKKTQKVMSWNTPNCKVLNESEVKQLVKLAMEIEDYYQGVPQDIEWVIKDKKIFVLQSRPITA